ncbi:MFS transporter [Embleya sp. NPDC001921]
MPAPRHDVDTSGPRRPGGALALLAFASLITSLDYNIVYVALPDIGAGVGFSAQTLQWVVSAYAVAFGAFLLLGGRMSDLLGRRRMFVLGLALFAVASSAGGLAREPGVLIAARAVQGLGGALLFPATLSLVNTTFAEGRERNHALSVRAATGSGGLILGSLLGGVLTQALGWEAVFFVNVPLAGGAALAAFVVLPADPARVSGRRFDVFGALTATLGSTLVVFTLVQGPESGWTSPLVAAGGALGVGLLVVFVVAEGRDPDALMPPRLLRDRSLCTGMAVAFLFMATLGTLPYFLTVYFQGVHGYSALRTGFAYLVPMGGGLIGSLLGGRSATRLGVRSTLPASLAVSAVGLSRSAWASRRTAPTSTWCPACWSTGSAKASSTPRCSPPPRPGCGHMSRASRPGWRPPAGRSAARWAWRYWSPSPTPARTGAPARRCGRPPPTDCGPPCSARRRARCSRCSSR